MKKLSLLPLLLCCSMLMAQPSRLGLDRALLFAVNDYDKMSDLANPIQNAKDIASELEQRYGFIVEIVANPTFQIIEQKIAAYKQQYAEGGYQQSGQLLVFFTGHGVKRGTNGYFMPSDADPNRPYALGMEYDFWRDEINNIDCKHILVAIDACHSITFDPYWQTKNDRAFNRPGERFADQVLLNHETYKARLFYTSDAEGEETPDRSTFAEQFLAGLRTHSSNSRYLTSSELFASYMKKAAPTPGGGSFGDNDAASAFLFFQQTEAISSARSDQEAWQLAEKTNTTAAYQRYLSLFPAGDFAAIAQKRLEALKAEEIELLTWQSAKQTHKAWAYRHFLQQHPASTYREVATLRIQELEPLNFPELDNMIFIKGGTFQMGSKAGEPDETPHPVSLNDFYLARYEVTFDEFDAFCKATKRLKPSDEKWGRGKRPAINISWYDAIEYCNWLSAKQGLEMAYKIDKSRKDPANVDPFDSRKWLVTVNWDAGGYRLPTEAEWEYAARSEGKELTWSGTSNSADLHTFANFNNKSDQYERTAPVGRFKPNTLGLFDMIGNVHEWCWDWYGTDYYTESPANNPKGPDSGPSRVYRGGSWVVEGPAFLRCANRSYISRAMYIRSFFGFRVGRSVKN